MWKEIIAHAIWVTFAGLVTLNAKPGSSVFSWHPFCMVIAVLLWTEGILSFRKAKRDLRVNIHWGLNGLATILALFGGLASYNHMENEKIPHFSTYHGIAGAVTMGLLLVQGFGGNLLVYRKNISFLKAVPPKLLKWGHRLAGIVALTAIYTTLFVKVSPVVSLALFYPYSFAVYTFINAKFSKDKPKEKVKGQKRK